MAVLPDFVLGPPYPSRPIDYVGQHTLRFAFLASACRCCKTLCADSNSRATAPTTPYIYIYTIATRVEAIAARVEAIATRVEAIATRVRLHPVLRCLKARDCHVSPNVLNARPWRMSRTKGDHGDQPPKARRILSQVMPSLRVLGFSICVCCAYLLPSMKVSLLTLGHSWSLF